MFRFIDDGPQHRGVSFRELLSLLRPAKPLTPSLKVRTCLIHGCPEPSRLNGFLCDRCERDEALTMYHPVTGWGHQ